MYFFNCTCLCLSGYKPYIIKKTKFESDCQIIGSAQNESFHARKMKRTCFNPCRGLRGIRRSRPAALPSIGYRGFAVAPITLRASSRNIVVITVTGAAIYETGAQCAPLRGTAMQPSVANASNRCNDATNRCNSPLQRPPSSREGDRRSGGRSSRIARPPIFRKLSIFPSPYLPHRGRGTALWAVEGVRKRWKA